MHPKMKKCLIALVVFGNSSANKIACSLKRLKTNYVMVFPGETPCFTPTHIILSGGPGHVYENNHHHIPEWVIKSDAPVLGVCYGMQIIAHTFGGNVIKMREKEHGPTEVTEIIGNQQLTNIRWMNRYDQVICVPNMFIITGVTNKNHIASFTDNKKWWAIQYHPESFKYGDISVFKRFINNNLCRSL